MAIVTSVDSTSRFRRKIRPGDELIAVNGCEICDFLDYTYQTAQGVSSLTVRRNGKDRVIRGNGETGDPGLNFDSFLMDKERSCKNKCVFCFIDQLPPAMRETMYYKDDDFRLSLLYGNYVTMTNMTERDVCRIEAMKVSPFNVSVHTTNPELRVKMMKNPAAARGFELMKRFARAGINLRAQIVLCPGWNDGIELDRTMRDLKTLWPQLSSVSVVPIGLTKFRDGLEPMRTFTPSECRDVIAQVEAFSEGCLREFGTRLIWCSDEFYVKGGVALHDDAYYEEYEQAENGVGMLTSFCREFDESLAAIENPISAPIRVSMVTGQITESFFAEILKKAERRLTDLQCRVFAVRNDFFGPEITVTGLVTGQDLLAQLRGEDLGDALLIPSVMLRDGFFLDDVPVSRIEEELGVCVKITDPSAEGFLRALTECART